VVWRVGAARVRVGARQQQIDAYRELATSLAIDDADTAA
jgi:hypothetical protein